MTPRINFWFREILRRNRFSVMLVAEIFTAVKPGRKSVRTTYERRTHRVPAIILQTGENIDNCRNFQ